MAQFYTDFSEYATGSPPAGWTSRFTSGASLNVSADAGEPGGKVLVVTHPATQYVNTHFSWDDINADANRDNVEVLFKAKGNGDGYAFVRGSGALSSENGYRIGRGRDSRIASLSAGAFSNVDSTVVNPPANTATWYWVRARANSTSISIKTWLDGDPEPGTWDTFTNSTVTGVGWVGFYARRGEDRVTTYSVFSVGTNGDAAPTTDPSADLGIRITDIKEPNVSDTLVTGVTNARVRVWLEGDDTGAADYTSGADQTISAGTLEVTVPGSALTDTPVVAVNWGAGGGETKYFRATPAIVDLGDVSSGP